MKKLIQLLIAIIFTTAMSQDTEIEIKNLSINNGYNNFGTSYFGKNIVFSSSNGNHLNLYNGAIKADDITTKKMFYKSDTHVTSVTFSKDLKTMYFTRSLFGEDNTIKYDKNKRSVIAIFKAIRASDGSWGNISPLPFNSENYDVGHPALSNDGKKLYFSSNMPGSQGSDIYVVDILGGDKFSTPQNLGSGVNSKGKELYPFVSSSNQLYYASTGMGGFGGMDIYVVDLNDKNSKAKLLPKPINSKFDDFSYIYNESTKQGFFSSNRPGGKGGDDIYFFKENEVKEEEVVVKKEVKKEECSQKLIGTVFLNATQKRISSVLVKLKNDDNKVVEKFKTDESGKFNFELKCSKKYKLEASRKGYKTSERLMITNSEDKIVFKKNLFVTKALPKGMKESFSYVGTVDFEYNEWDLLPRYTYELDKAVMVMKDNPKLTIYFESHTDSRAPTDFNMELSEKRIEVLKEYVGFKGIFRKRFSGKAFGETKPINKCVKGIICTDEEYLENRRTTFILKEKK